VDYKIGKSLRKARLPASETWTAEEQDKLLEYLRANGWSCCGFPGKHMFTVTQGGGGGGVHHTRYGGGKQDVRHDACA
jgi:hypothetical protein